MPDFERVFDDLALKTANDESQKQYVSGFIDGKTKARKQILLIVVIAFVIYAATKLAI